MHRRKEHPYKKYLKKFHILYYDSRVMMNTFFMGIKTPTCPLDMWILQEIIYEKMPDVIIETGTYHGGSALYLATICDAVKKGTIITIDIEQPDVGLPKHNRIVYLTGSSISQKIVTYIKSFVKNESVMVILDSCHEADHVFKELKIYSKIVSPGHYLIVSDTNLSGHPMNIGLGKGPMEGLQKFLKTDNDFEIDKEREKFGMTFHPSGYLKKLY